MIKVKNKMMLDDYFWIPIVGGIICFYTAWGGGANDCANAFATSVASKTLSLKQAVMIASIFEFLGAFLMGSHVTNTVRKGIVDPELFSDNPEVLMFGMFCACLGSGIWLTIATYFKLPVSTTHTTIGAICGFGLMYNPYDSIQWNKIIEIIISWFVSPILSGILTALIYILVRKYALRKENPTEKLLKMFPFLCFVTFFIYSFFIVYKGTPALGLKNTPLLFGLLISFGCGLFFALFAWKIGIPCIKKYTKNKNVVTQIDEIETNTNTNIQLNSENIQENIKVLEKELKKFKIKEKEEKLKLMYEHAASYDLQTENVCSSLQVITACFDSFSHGANDVANAIGPYAAIISIYMTGSVTKKTDVPWWILLIGAAGMVVGLATWGYKIIDRIGKDMTKITPSRGFTIELGSTMTVILASRIGLPVSTTHCQVGSIIGCGLCDGIKNLNYSTLIKIFFSWLITLPMAGIISAMFFSLGYFSPSF